MKIVKTLTLILFVTGLLVFFQNCGVGQNSGLLGSKSTSASIADTTFANVPFAYDMVADTISYNSCVGENLNSAGISGLKIGSNGGFVDSTGTGALKAGLKLRTEFLQYLGKNITPTYPSNIVTPAQIQSVLANSTLNKDAALQFAVRRKVDLSIVKDVIQDSLTTPINSARDGTVFNASLAQDPVGTNLAKNVLYGPGGVILSEGSYIYNLQSDATPAPIEASFGYSNIADETYSKTNLATDSENLGYGERYSEVVRNNFNGATGPNNQIILTSTFGQRSAGVTADNGLSTPKQSVPAKKGFAFGRGYALQFGLPANTVAAGWKNTVLQQVMETNLIDGTPVGGAGWSCENYLIMRQTEINGSDLSKPSCSPLTSSDLVDPNVSAKVKRIRRHYLESSWYIGFFYQANELLGSNPRLSHKICLVPKATECYLDTTTVVPPTDVGVNYNPLTECYLYNRFGTSYIGSITSVKANGRCAQFASVCTR